MQKKMWISVVELVFVGFRLGEEVEKSTDKRPTYFYVARIQGYGVQENPKSLRSGFEYGIQRRIQKRKNKS